MPTLYLYMQAQLVLLTFGEEFQHLQDDPGMPFIFWRSFNTWKSSLFSFFKTINPCFLLTTKAMVPNKLNGIYLFDFGTMALPLTTNYLTIALFLTKRKKITKEWENFFFSHANTSLKSKGIYYHNEIYFRDIFFVLFCKLFMFCFIWICFRQLP